MRTGTRVDRRRGMLRLALLSVFLLGCEGGKGGGTFPDGGGIGDGGSGRVCGGITAEQCPADEFCDFGTNSCGVTDEQGICVTRPTACPDIFDPVCGCDGQSHGNPCDAAAAGFDVNANGGCPVAGGRFECGFRQCDIANTYCQRAGSDIGGEPDGFTCIGLPVCAGPPSCACLQGANEPCATSCSGQGATGLTVVCLGG